jgi:hypothetical protein
LQDIQQAADEGDTDAATLSKYFGEYQANTHLVKGLDVAFAHTIKRDGNSKTNNNKDDSQIRDNRSESS